MKDLSKICIVLFIGLCLSCVDKKENENVEATLSEIESVETKIDSISVEVDQDAKALEEALEELDENNK